MTLEEIAKAGWALTVKAAATGDGSRQCWSASAMAAGSLCPRHVEIPEHESFDEMVVELERAIITPGVHDADWDEDRLDDEIMELHYRMVRLIEERARQRHDLDLLWRPRNC